MNFRHLLGCDTIGTGTQGISSTLGKAKGKRSKSITMQQQQPCQRCLTFEQYTSITMMSFNLRAALLLSF